MPVPLPFPLLLHLFLLLPLLLLPCQSAVREPRTFNLRDQEHPDAAEALDKGLLRVYPGPGTRQQQQGGQQDGEQEQQHFRLLLLDGDFLLLGAADAVHNLSMASFQPVGVYRWEAGEEERRDCRMKSPDESLCRNFVRVLARLTDGRRLVCGTNAFQPACRVLSPTGDTLAQLSGLGLVPMEPTQNSSHLMAGNQLYSATAADFAGNDPLLFRRNVSDPGDRGLRTQRGNPLMLDRPHFVDALQTDQFVYLFFREEAAEADQQSFSRVARVCKSDRGGPRHYGQEWTSFVKARLNCSLGGGAHGRPFYFDQLMAVSQPVHGDLVYATFTSEFDFLRHSVVCAFRLTQMDQLFRSSAFLAFDPTARRWIRRPRDDLGLGQCQPPADSRQLSEDEALARRMHPLMADAVPNALWTGGAAGIHRGTDQQYSQVAVVPSVRHRDGQADVLFVATDQGNVLKLVNLASPQSQREPFGQANWTTRQPVDQQEDPLLPVAVVQLSHAPIRRLLVPAQGQHLLVVTDSALFRLPLHLCGLHPSCHACVGSRDPHCVWHGAKCRGRDEVGTDEPLVQDVMGRRGEKLCAGLEVREVKSRQETQTKPQFLSPAGRNNGSKYETVDGSDPPDKIDGKLKPAATEKCNCSPKWVKCACDLSEQMLLAKEPPVRGKSAPNSKEAGNLFLWLADFPALPWWVLLLTLLASVQTISFLWLCCRWQRLKRCASGPRGEGRPEKRLSPSDFSSPYSSPVASSGGLINAYSPASVFSAPARDSSHHQSGQWTLSSALGPLSQRSSPESVPKSGSDYYEPRRGASAFLQGILVPRRASVSGGEISVQLEGSSGAAANTTTTMTLPLPLHLPMPVYSRHQPAMSTFSRR